MDVTLYAGETGGSRLSNDGEERMLSSSSDISRLSAGRVVSRLILGGGTGLLGSVEGARAEVPLSFRRRPSPRSAASVSASVAVMLEAGSTGEVGRVDLIGEEAGRTTGRLETFLVGNVAPALPRSVVTAVAAGLASVLLMGELAEAGAAACLSTLSASSMRLARLSAAPSLLATMADVAGARTAQSASGANGGLALLLPTELRRASLRGSCGTSSPSPASSELLRSAAPGAPPGGAPRPRNGDAALRTAGWVAGFLGERRAHAGLTISAPVAFAMARVVRMGVGTAALPLAGAGVRAARGLTAPACPGVRGGACCEAMRVCACVCVCVCVPWRKEGI